MPQSQPMSSDDLIKQRVQDELRWTPCVNDTDISVDVNDGVVTLSGAVDSYSAKYAAEESAHHVRGVLGVVNNIDVLIPPVYTRTDADIQTAAYNALEWDTLVPVNRVTVTVNDGWVTLTGNVDWRYQKEAAENDARDLVGVKGVSNLITVVAPQVSPLEIKAKIREALERRAQLDAQRIKVDTRQGTVILTGTAGSWAERQAAEGAAWSAPGVTNVENQIVIAP